MPFSLKHFLIFIFSAVIFAVAAYFTNMELLDIVQARFYNPSVVNSVIKENSVDADLVQSHITELQLKFASALGERGVRNSFLYNQNAEDIFERSRIFGILMEATNGLQSAQFVDANGIRIHYSTSARDVLSQTRDSTAYRNYNENPYVLPFEQVNVPSNGGSKFIMDAVNDRIIFSYPFRDSMDVYRGTALFTVSIRALAEKLTAEGNMKTSDNISLIEAPPGIVFGIPDTSKAEILSKVASIWNNGIQDNVTFDTEDSGIEFALISAKTTQGIFVGRLVNNSIFSIPNYMRIILLLSIFLTFYLVITFLANLRPDPAVLVQNRIKKLRKNIFKRLESGNQDMEKFVFELEQRREEIHSELKHKLKISRGREKKIDTLIDKSWNEMLAEIMVDGDYTPTAYVKTDKIIDPSSLEDEASLEDESSLEDVASLEELEEIDEIEEIEEIGEAEPAEELDEIEEIEEFEEIEEIGEAEPADEIEEFEELEEIEEIEEIEEDEPSDEPDEIEVFEEIEEIEEAESSLEEIVEAEPAVEIEEIEEAEPDELEEIAPLEIEELEPEKPQAVGGLLARASSSSLPSEYEEPLEELKPAVKKKARKKPVRGLLNRAQKAGSDEEPDNQGSEVHGLFALASAIEFDNNIPAGKDEKPEDLQTDVEVVSPFSSMFTILK